MSQNIPNVAGHAHSTVGEALACHRRLAVSAAEAPPLDVERLRRAGRAHNARHEHAYIDDGWIREIAAEYARLSPESSQRGDAETPSA